MREQTAQPKAPWGSLLGYCRSLGGTGTVLLSVSLISQSRRGPRLRALHASCEKELSTARGSKGAKEKEIDFVCSSSQCSVRRCRFSSGASGFRALW